jgi:ABC-type multidrug transport system ATPase subunit
MTGAVVFENVTARIAGVDLVGVSFTHEGGVLAIVGAASDGAGALLAIAAGAARPGRGRVVVLGSSPGDVGARIAQVPLAPSLPEAVRVGELVDLAATLRGDAIARTNERLASFGLDTLAARDTRTLSIAEARAVLACEAFTSERVELVLFEEPLARIAPAAAAAIPRAIRSSSAAIVVATASPSDARLLAERFAILRQGRLLAVAGALDSLALLGAHGARLVAATDGAHALAAAIGDRSLRIEIEPGRLTLEGPDPVALAHALQRAIVSTRVEVESVRIDPLSLQPLQAAATADQAAAYEATLARARAAIPMPAPMAKP